MITVTIAGVALSPHYNTLHISMKAGIPASCDFEYHSLDGSVVPVAGQEVTVFQDANPAMWSGTIDEVTRRAIFEGDPLGQAFSIKCASWEQRLQRRVCNDLVTGFVGLYLDEMAGDIVLKIINDFLFGDGIVPAVIHAGAFIEGARVYDGPVADALDDLARRSSVAGAEYVWFIDPAKGLHFIERGADAAPFDLATLNNYRNVAVRTTREDKFNELLIRVGWKWFDVDVDTFVGDGNFHKGPDVVGEWLLTRNVDQIVYMRLNGADKSFGQPNVDSGFVDYYYEYVKRAGVVYTRIIQESNAIALEATDTLEVGYRSLGKDLILSDDFLNVFNTHIQEGGSGRYQAIVIADQQDGQVQALAKADALVASHKLNANALSYETDFPIEPLCLGLRPGQLQNVVNPFFGLNGQFLIDEVNIHDVDGQFLRFQVGALDKPLGGYVDYYKALVSQPEKNLSPPVASPQFFSVFLSLGIGTPQLIGNDIDPARAIAVGGTLLEALFTPKIALTGTLNLDIKRSQDFGITYASILTAPMVVPAGQVATFVATNFAISQLARFDRVRFDLLAGSAEDCMDATCELRWQ